MLLILKIHGHIFTFHICTKNMVVPSSCFYPIQWHQYSWSVQGIRASGIPFIMKGWLPTSVTLCTSIVLLSSTVQPIQKGLNLRKLWSWKWKEILGRKGIVYYHYNKKHIHTFTVPLGVLKPCHKQNVMQEYAGVGKKPHFSSLGALYLFP